MGTGISKILITGGTGFVGKHLLQALSVGPYEMHLIVRDLHTAQLKLPFLSAAAFHEANSEVDGIVEAIEPDVIIHLATTYGHSGGLADMLRSNVLLPIRLAEAAERYGVKGFINTDTFFSKKNIDYTWQPEYTATKKLVLEYFWDRKNSFKFANLRLEHVFGEHDNPNKFFPQIIRQLKQDVPQIALTAGTQQRDFIYVKDTVKAFVTIIENVHNLPARSEFGVGLGTSRALREVVAELKKAIGADTRLDFGALPMREGEPMYSAANNAELLQLGWQPDYTLEEGIAAMVRNFNDK